MKVFLSYSSRDTVFANNLDSELRKFGANIFRDERELQFLQNITSFMQSITKMDYSIMLVSPAYLKSRPCIYEFTEYLKKEGAEKSIVPILLSGFRFSNELRNEIIAHIHANVPAVIDTRTWYRKLFSKLKDKDYILNDWLTRFNTTWEFLVDTKLFNYEASKAGGFTNILSFLHIYDKDIIEEIQKIINIKDWEEQDIRFLELTNKHPGSYWVIRYRAYLCTRQKHYKKAILLYKEFLSKFTDKLDMVSGYYDIGVCFYKLGHYLEAIRWHEQAIAIYPFAYLSHRGLGDAYLKLNDLEKAYKHLVISEKYESNFLVLNNLGALAMEFDKISEGIAYFEKAIEMNGNDPLTYLNLSSAYASQNDEVMRNKVLSQAYAKFPNDYQVLTRYAIKDLKESYTQNMVTILRKSFQLNPNFIETRIYLGTRLVVTNPNPEVKRELKELLFAKKLLVETLKMELFEDEREVIISHLRILAILLKDKSLERFIGQ